MHELKSATNSDVFGIASALKRAVPDDKITHLLNFLTYCINSSGAQHTASVSIYLAGGASGDTRILPLRLGV